MINFIKKALGLGTSVSYADLVSNGAVIIDVRTKGEYLSGHIKEAINIPLDQLNNSLPKLKKDQSIITCCASGIRSASGKSILKANGFINVYNGGGWTSLQRKLNKAN
ncbi:MAG: sulfurtransferase [Chitinophagaceae bacterium]|nr:sulfurtransferase [Chitinophagaceae bacterium]